MCGIDASVRDRRERAGSTPVRRIDASTRDRRERTGSTLAHGIEASGRDRRARTGSKRLCGIEPSVRDRCACAGICKVNAPHLSWLRVQSSCRDWLKGIYSCHLFAVLHPHTSMLFKCHIAFEVPANQTPLVARSMGRKRVNQVGDTPKVSWPKRPPLRQCIHHFRLCGIHRPTLTCVPCTPIDDRII